MTGCFAITLLAGCASSSAKLPGAMPSPLMHASAIADTTVWLEDQCEDPVEDAKTVTQIESTADVLAMPYIAIIYMLRISSMVLVALPMAYMGYDLHATVQKIKLALPYSLAGPNPDTTDYKNVRLIPSCLFASK